MSTRSRIISGFVVAICAAALGLTGCGNDKKEVPKAAVEPQPAQTSTAQAPVAAQSPGAPQTSAPAAASAGDAQLPPKHPPVDKRAENITMAQHVTMKTQKQVRVSKEVKDKWKEVTLEVGDMTTKKSVQAVIKIGATVPIKGTAFTLTVENFVPDYVLSADMKFIESRSNQPKNPAVLLSLNEGKKQVARGWVFKTLPSFNSFNHPKILVGLVGPFMTSSTEPGASSAVPAHGK